MVFVQNSDNNRVGATNSGQTNTFTVTNPSNTASSAARETITVGGGTAGDPTLNFNVSGVTNFEMGIDNSVNDNLTISQGTALGTNDVWRMDTSGRRTMPLQPCFSSFLSASVLNVTGDGTTYTIICDTTIFDQNSNYNQATGIFTAPITGKYILVGNIGMLNINAAFIQAVTLINTTARQYVNTTLNVAVVKDGSNGYRSPIFAIADMTVGDTAKIQINVSGGTKTLTIQGDPVVLYTSFQGFLLC